MRFPLSTSRVQHWLNSISSQTTPADQSLTRSTTSFSGPPIVIVGTHLDDTRVREGRENLETYKEQLAESLGRPVAHIAFVSAISGKYTNLYNYFFHINTIYFVLIFRFFRR